jgi:hypothetical protein
VLSEWIGPIVSRRLSPARPVRTAITLARIETTVSSHRPLVRIKEVYFKAHPRATA